MPYSNTWKLGNGSKITINSVEYLDATSVTVPDEMRELVEITTLGSTRKEWVASDMPDSDEITVTLPYTGTIGSSIVTGTAVTCAVFLAKLNGGTGYTFTFTGIVTKAAPSAAEVDGKLAWEITIKPTTILTRS